MPPSLPDASEEILAAGAAPPAAAAAPAISVVVPLYNEAASLPELYERIRAALDAHGRPWEAVLVNDGSRDETARVLDELVARDPRVVAVHFRRNFGQTAGLTAGFEHARGEVLVAMDGDLQNDPRDIPALLAKLDEGYDVVSGWRRERQDTLSKRLPSKVANRLISLVTGVRLHDYGCALKAYRREVMEGVILYGEMHRFTPVYAALQGARVAELPVSHEPRRHGRSNYGLERTAKVLLDLMVVKFFASYMTKPIYIFGGFGLGSLFLSFLCWGLALVLKIVPAGDFLFGVELHKNLIRTPLPLLGSVFFLVGIVMILQGLLAEVVIRTYYESQGKRAYVIGVIRDRRPARAPAP